MVNSVRLSDDLRTDRGLFGLQIVKEYIDNPCEHWSFPIFIPSKIASHCFNASDCRFGDHRQTARKEIGGYLGFSAKDGQPKMEKMKLQVADDFTA